MALHHPRVNHRDGHESPHPIGVVDGQPEAEPCSPIVAHDVRSSHAQGVEDRQHIGHPLEGGVAPSRRVTRAESAHIQRDHVPVVSKWKHQSSPHVRVLRKAVQQDEPVRDGLMSRR
jgi:hypothetical protein